MKRSPVTIYFEKPISKEKSFWISVPLFILLSWQAITNIENKVFLFQLIVYWMIFIGYIVALTWKGRRYISLSNRDVKYYDRYFKPKQEMLWEDVKLVIYDGQNTIFKFKNGRHDARFHAPLDMYLMLRDQIRAFANDAGVPVEE